MFSSVMKFDLVQPDQGPWQMNILVYAGGACHLFITGVVDVQYRSTFEILIRNDRLPYSSNQKRGCMSVWVVSLRFYPHLSDTYSACQIVTYIVEGDLTHKDSMGTAETLGRGSIQFMTAGTGVSHSEHNKNPTNPLRFIQVRTHIPTQACG